MNPQIHNKKVILIGGAEFTADLKDYDVVVSINENPPFPKFLLNENYCRFFTGECALGLPKPYLYFRDHMGNVEFVGSREQYRDDNPFGPQYEWANSLRKVFFDYNPLAGSFALEYLRIQRPKSIHVDGMTLYHDEFKPLTNFERGGHFIKDDINYMKAIIELQDRVKRPYSYSDYLNKVLDLY